MNSQSCFKDIINIHAASRIISFLFRNLISTNLRNKLDEGFQFFDETLMFLKYIISLKNQKQIYGLIENGGREYGKEWRINAVELSLKYVSQIRHQNLLLRCFFKNCLSK